MRGRDARATKSAPRKARHEKRGAGVWCFAVALVVALIFTALPVAAQSGDDAPTSPTTTVVYSDVGVRGGIVVPAVEVPAPGKPFLMVVGDVATTVDSVRVDFGRDAADPAPASGVIVLLLAADAPVPADPAAVVAAGTLAVFDADGKATVTFKVEPKTFAREFKIVYVGRRVDT